jgi:hypothetical protein
VLDGPATSIAGAAANPWSRAWLPILG